MTPIIPAWRLPAALTLVACLAACATPPAATPSAAAQAAAAPTPRPKLLVFLVVDGLPMRQVTGFRDQLAPDGLARFLERGTWYADAHYGHAFTVTAAGHATMLTGAYPKRTGIIGNEWRNPVTGETEYCTGDPSATYIGHQTARLDGTSPKNLQAETVGDVLRRATPASKVISISGKDRGAILPAGKSGTAYMYMSTSGQFASSTYYMARHPAWVDAFNAARPADRYFRTEWKPLLPDAAYARSLPDNQPWYGKDGKLPLRMQGEADATKPTPAFYSRLLASPFGDELTLDFARAAIAGEQLGQDSAPDILSISLSSHDYVNHQWSAESRFSHDHLLQLDRQFQAFFQHLDATIGKGNYIAALTSDHGFMPAPEASKAQGLDAGRINANELLARVNAGLQQRFGVDKLARGLSASGLLLDRELVTRRALDMATVQDAARKLLLAEPGIAVAYTRSELAGAARPGAPYFNQMSQSFNHALSADVQVALKPLWMLGNTPATHGSPYPYDTHVPILLYGPGWLPAGRVDRRVEVADIAPTLAGLLGVAVPAQSEGRPLPLPGAAR